MDYPVSPPSVFPPDFDYRPSGERAGREFDAIQVAALADAAPARAEADRLAMALTKATDDHLAAIADLDRLAAALEQAIVDGSDVAKAEKALAEGPARVERLRHRVEVLRAAADRAAVAADEAEEVAGNKLCWVRLPAARAAVDAAAEALREYDAKAEADAAEKMLVEVAKKEAQYTSRS